MVQAALKTWCLHYDKSEIAIYGAFGSRIGVLSYANVFRVHLSPHEELDVILQHWESAFWKVSRVRKNKSPRGAGLSRELIGIPGSNELRESTYGRAAQIFIFRH